MAVIRNRIERIGKSFVDFASDESGAGYTLSYVMVMPLLMLLVAMVVESATMLTAKLGTVHAAFVAARVASVQTSATSWPDAEAKIEAAARQAFIPFANGSDRSSGQGTSTDADYRKAYRDWADDAVADAYLQSKQRDVINRLQVTFDGPPASWDSQIVAEVTYRYPFRIPGIGRLIGDADGDGFAFPLTSRVTLSGDGPQNDSQSLGIGYASP